MNKKIWHHWEKWECYKVGFYADIHQLTMSKEECILQYQNFLSDLTLFEKILQRVITEWKYSCEHFLTDKGRNRIAWLGQASMALHLGIPHTAKSGFKLLSEEQQDSANKLALKYLRIWEDAQKNK